MPNGQELNTQNNAQEEGLPGTADDAGVYGVLKCYFFTPKRGDIWGAFCFMFDGATGETMENVFWVTRALAGPSIDVNMQWKALNKMIPQMGVYEKSLGDKLSVLMFESIPSTSRVELCQTSAPAERVQAIAGEVRSSFERGTHCFLEFKMAFERISKQEMVNSGVLAKGDGSSESSSEPKPFEEKSFTGTVITCLPVIDPVHGRPVSELQPGDMVEVKLQGGVGASDLIHKFLQSNNQDAIFPVDSVEKTDSEKTHVILKISDEISGVVTVTKDLRLRVLSVGGRKKLSVTFNPDNMILFGVIGVGLLVIWLVASFLLP